MTVWAHEEWLAVRLEQVAFMLWVDTEEGRKLRVYFVDDTKKHSLTVTGEKAKTLWSAYLRDGE